MGEIKENERAPINSLMSTSIGLNDDEQFLHRSRHLTKKIVDACGLSAPVNEDKVNWNSRHHQQKSVQRLYRTGYGGNNDDEKSGQNIHDGK